MHDTAMLHGTNAPLTSPKRFLSATVLTCYIARCELQPKCPSPPCSSCSQPAVGKPQPLIARPQTHFGLRPQSPRQRMLLLLLLAPRGICQSRTC